MILNRAERMLARRYLLPGKGEGFIFLVASISLIAVALGVAALIIVMSVMNGFRAELFEKIVGLNGHAEVVGYDGRLSDWQQISVAAKNTPGITSALPLIETPLMATANGRFEGVLVRGMRVEDIRSNTAITSNVLAGDIRSIVPGSNRVAIGSRSRPATAEGRSGGSSEQAALDCSPVLSAATRRYCQQPVAWPAEPVRGVRCPPGSVAAQPVVTCFSPPFSLLGAIDVSQ